MTFKIRQSPTYAGEVMKVLDKGQGGQVKCIYTPPVPVAPAVPMTNLLAWYKADYNVVLVDEIGSVGQWQDASGNGHTLFLYGASPSPVLDPADVNLNSLPSVTFSGGELMATTDTGWLPLGSSARTVYLVAYTADHTATAIALYWGSSGVYTHFLMANIPDFCITAEPGLSYTAPLYDFWSFYSTYSYPAGSDLLSNDFYVTDVIASAYGNSAVLNTTDSPLFVGYQWTGAIGEILIYDVAHDAITQSAITSYLATKWNIQPYVPPSVNPYCPADTNPATGIDVSTLAMYDPPVTARGEWSVSSPWSVHRGGGASNYANYFVAVGMQSGVTYQIELTSDVDAVDPPTGEPVDTYLYMLSGPCSYDSILTSDDDSGFTFRQSRIIWTPATSGNYSFECTTFSAATTGYFQIKISIPAA